MKHTNYHPPVSFEIETRTELNILTSSAGNRIDNLNNVDIDSSWLDED